jgi:hypothetical protein
MPVPNIERLRARVVWLAAKNRFIRGATVAKFTRSQLDSMLDIEGADDALEVLARVVEQIPANADPSLGPDGDLTLHNPERRSVAPDAEDVDRVAQHWMLSTGRTAKSLTERRLGLIRARLRDGWSVEQLEQAVDACLKSDWHTGSNPNGLVYTDTAHIFTVERLEQWLSHEPQRDSRGDAVDKAMAETVRRRRRKA